MSDRDTPRACPDPSTLAAFLAGLLDAQLRRQVEQHVADCQECPIVIAETSRFLRDESEENDADPESLMPRRRWWIAAAIAALCLTALVWQRIRNDDPLRDLKRLAARSPVRTVEGRLAEFEHAPFSKVRSEQNRAVEIEFRAAAERLTDSGGTDARMLHAQGIALLLSGKADQAIPLLTRAANVDPQHADFWNDLSAASIATARADDHESLLTALAAADRAIALSPTSGASHFNRAVALHHLGRYDEAIAEYRRVIDLEPRSRWSEEAKTRISDLQQ